MPLITLLTDFGLEDEYAGVMKGVILSINPNARIVDITHGIPPQNVRHAALVLSASVHYFPKNTIHIAVVDPGVGTDRGIIAARSDNWTIVAPDNGLMDRLVPEDFSGELVAVENKACFLPKVSQTFHGRDIFAPVGARLSLGLSLSELGAAKLPQQLVRLKPLNATIGEDHAINGHVVYQDRFGNLITNIDEGLLRSFGGRNKGASFAIAIKNSRIFGVAENYAHGRDGKLIALIGSRGCLELAVCGGSAARLLSAGPGERIRVSLFDR